MTGLSGLRPWPRANVEGLGALERPDSGPQWPLPTLSGQYGPVWLGLTEQAAQLCLGRGSGPSIVQCCGHSEASPAKLCPHGSPVCGPWAPGKRAGGQWWGPEGRREVEAQTQGPQTPSPSSTQGHKTLTRPGLRALNTC